MYKFNPDVTPKEVFERYFGTKNPYEALEGECTSATCSYLFSFYLTPFNENHPLANAAISAQFEAMTTEERPVKGKSKVVS
jgi:DnaJ family protein B protein 13